MKNNKTGLANICKRQATKYLVLLISLFIHCHTAKGQKLQIWVMEPDSLIINKTWNDRNGENNLYIRVYAACNPDKPPFDAHLTQIQAHLKNASRNLKIEYDEPDYQMCMIFLSEKDIWFHDVNGIKAVFIPFTYCGNEDTTVLLSYIILYKKHKYLFHFTFECNEDFEDGSECILDEKSARKQIKKLPKELREVLFNHLKENYKTEIDFI